MVQACRLCDRTWTSSLEVTRLGCGHGPAWAESAVQSFIEGCSVVPRSLKSGEERLRRDGFAASRVYGSYRTGVGVCEPILTILSTSTPRNAPV